MNDRYTEVPLTITAYEGTPVSSFRTELFEVVDDHDLKIGSFATGSGFGSDALVMRYRDRAVSIRGRDLFVAWVRTFDPKAAGELEEIAGVRGNRI